MMNWNPSVEVESARGIREVSLTTHHLMNRKIFLNGEINSDAAQRFLEQMLYMEEQKEPVSLMINSPGGEVNAGLMICDVLQGARVPVDVFCTGRAASMAAVILAVGRKGHRFILPHSEVMIHEPLIAGGLGGSASSIQSISESILEIRNIINGILARRTGKSLEEINEATLYNHFMNAEQAVTFGICDKITDHI